jgi:hypothetical protein
MSKKQEARSKKQKANKKNLGNSKTKLAMNSALLLLLLASCFLLLASCYLPILHRQTSQKIPAFVGLPVNPSKVAGTASSRVTLYSGISTARSAIRCCAATSNARRRD